MKSVLGVLATIWNHWVYRESSDFWVPLLWLIEPVDLLRLGIVRSLIAVGWFEAYEILVKLTCSLWAITSLRAH